MPKREKLSSFQMVPIPEEEAPEGDTLQSRLHLENKRLILIILAASATALILALLCVLLVRPPWLMGGSSRRTETPTTLRTGTPSSLSIGTLTSHATLQNYLPVVYQSTSVEDTGTTPPNGTLTNTVTTATQTPAPSLTPGGDSVFHIVIAIQNDDSLFMKNEGTVDLPLKFIQLGDGQKKILGEEWKIDLLVPGQCVGVWRDEGLPFPPSNIKCEIVGDQLRRTSADRFWKSEFSVYYQDLLVGTCKKDEGMCEFIFSKAP